MKILYVEDDALDADLMQRWLRKRAPQFILETVTTYGDALARLKWPGASPPYDLVLTDLRLPDGNGISLLNYIRERALPLAVVVLTGTGDEGAAVAAIKAGVDDYMAKRNGYLERLPFTLVSALNRHRAETARQVRPLRVLYAEHHHTDIDLTRRHLQRYAPHIQLEVALTGAEALADLARVGEASCYDVILLDYKLPGMNALEALKELRKNPGLDIPVVLITGQGDEELAPQALKLGAASYLVKTTNYLYQLPGELENAFYRAELIREQAALSQSEARNKAMLNAIPDMMFLQTKDGVYLDYHVKNPSELLVPPAQFIGKNVRDVMPPELAARFLQSIEETARSGQTSLVEYALMMSGKERHYEARIVNCDHGKIMSVVRDITERKLIEQQLSASEERFRLAQQAARVGTWSWNILTGESKWSEGIYTLLGLEQGNGTVSLENFVEFIHPEDLDRVLDKVQSVIKNGEHYDDEFRIICPDGTVSWLASKGRTIRNAAGQAEWMIGINLDITDRKRAEAERIENEVRLQEAQAIAHVGSFHWDIAANTTLWSDEVYRIFGLNRGIAKITYETFIKHVHPDYQGQVRGVVERALNSGMPFEHEYRIVQPTGEPRWIFARCQPMFDAVGTMIALHGICQDITERKQAEQAMRESEMRYRALFEKASDAILLVTERDEIVEVNQGACDLFGYSRKQLLAMKMSAVQAPEMCDLVCQVVTRGLEKSRDVRFESVGLQRDGRRIPVEITCTRVEEGERRLVLSIVRDITERKRIEHQKQEQITSIVETETKQNNFTRLIGQSDALRAMIRTAEKVAAADISPVLITGETGTGKGMVARAIHYASQRAGFAFSHIDCASIPETLFESELFGHEQGAFTDARKSKRGRLELAKGGTVFLDEISEIPLILQAKLLQLLQDGIFHRIGGPQEIALNARVIAATNRNLRAEVAAGRFRADLYQRLFVVQIDVPPLRERAGDTLLLAGHFLAIYNKKHGKNIRHLAPEVADALNRYAWPGNVRELEHAIERAVLFEESEEITLKHLGLETEAFVVPSPKESAVITPIQIGAANGTLDQITELLIKQVVEQCAGNITKSARRLGISRSRVYRVLHGTNPPDSSNPENDEEERLSAQYTLGLEETTFSN